MQPSVQRENSDPGRTPLTWSQVVVGRASEELQRRIPVAGLGETDSNTVGNGAQLQVLNRFCYEVSISRVQTRVTNGGQGFVVFMRGMGDKFA